MVTRVIAIPDSRGIIRVSCGPDIIEIEVVSPVPVATANPPDVNPFGNPVAAVVTTGSGEGGGLDIDQILRDADRQIADPTLPNPELILLETPRLDVHEISDLGQRIAGTTADLPLGVDFRETGEE